MPDTTENSSRIAKNTIMLYLRMILLLAISLYTSRVILEELGVVDYGVYNVVSGFIVLLSFINSGISSSTSRYITFALGKNDSQFLKNVFSMCLESHILISLLILIIGETLGLWMVTDILDIPDEKRFAAFWVYQCAIISTLLNVWSVPYNACIIAHEKMSAFAYISIFEAFAKLFIVFLLSLFNDNRLIVYAVFMLSVQFIITVTYVIYNLRHFEESKPHFYFEKALFKETMSFAGWNLWGGLSVAMFTQGVNILLNIFFGPVVNTARGLAVTVQTTVQKFATNFQTAINPQIIKTYASGEMSQMYGLICRSSKFSFFLLFCLILPIILETPFILKLWLKEVPEYTGIFVRIMLCICIVDGMANPFMTAMVATGDVKKYQIIVGGTNLSIIPLGYLVLKLGGAPASIFLVQLGIFVIAFFLRLRLVSSAIDFSVRSYYMLTIMPCLRVLILALGAAVMLKYCVLDNSLFIMATAFVISIIAAYFIGLTCSEKAFVNNKIKEVLIRLHIKSE